MKLKLFEDFSKEYKSIYGDKPTIKYRREPEFEELRLKTRDGEDYIININVTHSNFTKEDLEVIWEDFKPIYDSYGLELSLSDEYQFNQVSFGVAANAFLDIFYEGNLEEIEEFEEDLRSFLSGLDKLGIKSQVSRDDMDIDGVEGYEIAITFFKKRDWEYEED